MYHLVLIVLTFAIIIVDSQQIPPCSKIPKLLCCTDRVLENCLDGCLDYVNEKCPQKLNKFERISQQHDNSATAAAGKSIAPAEKYIKTVRGDEKTSTVVNERNKPPSPFDEFSSSTTTNTDYTLLDKKYPITEVSDDNGKGADCGVETSQPPYSPCLSRRTVDDVFLSCCQQHVPSECHSLCTYEHREHVAAETLINAIQQDGCDLKHVSKILYCAAQNRDNRKCCEHLGLANVDLAVGRRCLRMCNIAYSGDRIGTLTTNDLVCLSNWNVIMYCSRSGLKTIS